jgi:hypothetical protein
VPCSEGGKSIGRRREGCFPRAAKHAQEGPKESHSPLRPLSLFPCTSTWDWQRRRSGSPLEGSVQRGRREVERWSLKVERGCEFSKLRGGVLLYYRKRPLPPFFKRRHG